MPLHRLLSLLLAGFCLASAGKLMAQTGVEVDKPSALRKLVPAAELERQASQEYRQLLEQARAKGALAPPGHPQLQRLRSIAQRLIPHAGRFNRDAARWKWEVNLIGSKQINAFCMPGGKIAFYTGLVEGLRLTDDEIAMVMGHEMAHALREHARERIAKSQLTQLGAGLLGSFIGDGRYAQAFRFGGDMLTLKFSRDDETEADVVGLDLAARAGFDPRAGITLWQKMQKASQGGGIPWFSSHPSGENRIEEIEKQLPKVLPLYEGARSRGTP
ncbi:M48 family metallopeptidase [Azovibrio restrictus]|uniref:M48 family metallopeptidase n=1 Tax=Azovibrio restrictus TaxID=146938 RepID=UPI0026EC8803|nr:M48 family metallopeptidase [Azovibrio restrictus]